MTFSKNHFYKNDYLEELKSKSSGEIKSIAKE